MGGNAVVAGNLLRVLWFIFFTLEFAAVTLAQTPGKGSPADAPALYKVRTVRGVIIPMRDGVKLSVDLVRPEQEGKFPIVMEYSPYRRSSLFGWQTWFAERGFVAAFLNARGTGGSEGINTDEYTVGEQLDGYDAVEWLARQPWSNGNVGMIGLSYGGFTAIQVAMHRPPHLKAIIPIYATDDRYTDDCHYSQGGNMRMPVDVGAYAGFMVAMNALPPYPEVAGPAWAKIWKHRLENNEPYLLKWMKEQVDGPYWRNGSLRPDYGRIQCPVFLIAGWHDAYASAQLRMFKHLTVPKKILCGPWVHYTPDSSVPGPRIDAFNEAARFFAHWLKGEDTGLMREPPVSIYMQEYATPDRTLDIIPGHWRNDPDLPVPGSKDLPLYLAANNVLAKQPNTSQTGESDEYEYHPTVGVTNAYWSSGAIKYALAEDQRPDEAYSLVYTSAPFEQEVKLLGWPQVIVHASSSARVATFVAKLSNVAPDGHSALITDGSLNGTRRASYTDPTPMTPGEIYELRIPMLPTGWVVKPGHRLRLAISSSDFPNLWPTPERARNSIHRSKSYLSRLILPVVPDSKLPPPQFRPAQNSASPGGAPQFERLDHGPNTQQVLYDQITGDVSVLRHVVLSTLIEGNLGSLIREFTFRCSASSRDPAHSSIVAMHRFELKREDGTIEAKADSAIRATKDAFHIIINLNVTRNGMPFFNKQWTASEPRRLL